jgi:uncharacterized sporulation protein YeaH/YhbH (DUF444 family)
MCHIIDRRLNGRNKSAVNRQRFIRRYKAQLRKAAADAVAERGVTDASGEQVGIPRRDISEPAFRHGRGGRVERIHPGNREFVSGDRVPRPEGGVGGSGAGDASEDGEGEDDFTFRLSRDEFFELFFEDLELPRLEKTRLEQVMETHSVRAGYAQDGVAANLALVRSLQGALARRIALQGPSRRALREAEAELETLETSDDAGSTRALDLDEEIRTLRRRIASVPFIDTFDLRYHNRVPIPKPKTQAVMFCLLDVSGSMDEQRKDIAKRFFMLLYFFLTRSYEHIHVVFLRHHTSAQEVDEEDFFHARETGGTIVSSVLELMGDIIDARYPEGEWNIYGAQASDGDNWGGASDRCVKLLAERILPKVQYFAYVQIEAEAEQSLWQQYATLRSSCEHLAMRKIKERGDIYPVFRELMRKRDHA